MISKVLTNVRKMVLSQRNKYKISKSNIKNKSLLVHIKNTFKHSFYEGFYERNNFALNY